ncbi:MAG TPA: hypothetical protein PL033_01045 [Candidatus Brocadiia bacterium]|nr:hypothetical protein [Candidatus Brocadiia bacterium]
MTHGEELCRRCGKCCREKLIVADVIFATPIMCGWYDRETGLCRVYDRRHEVNPDCLDRDAAATRGVFPADCPYVQNIKGYVAPIEGVVDAGLLAMVDGGLITDEERLRQEVVKRMTRMGMRIPRSLTIPPHFRRH